MAFPLLACKILPSVKIMLSVFGFEGYWWVLDCMECSCPILAWFRQFFVCQINTLFTPQAPSQFSVSSKALVLIFKATVGSNTPATSKAVFLFVNCQNSCIPLGQRRWWNIRATMHQLGTQCCGWGVQAMKKTQQRGNQVNSEWDVLKEMLQNLSECVPS